MIKPLIAIALASIITPCFAEEPQTATPKEQVAVAAKMCADNTEAMSARHKAKPLYYRLGEREGIKTFATKLLASHKQNPQISHIFSKVPEEKFVTSVTDYISAGSGGGNEYKGRDMLTIHKDMAITNEHFLAAGADAQMVMKEMGLGENEIQEMVCSLVAMVPQVVTK